jgi:hypothetical protein
MPWYNADFSFAFNVFAHAMLAVGCLVVGTIFVNFCWWLFCQAFKLVDGIVNDYHYD